MTKVLLKLDFKLVISFKMETLWIVFELTLLMTLLMESSETSIGKVMIGELALQCHYDITGRLRCHIASEC